LGRACGEKGLLYDVTAFLLSVVDDLRTLTELDPEIVELLTL
jgi:hypothetical protein